MSHTTVIKRQRENTQFVSRKHLLEALYDMGFQDVEVHEKATPLKKAVGDQEESREAEIILRKRHLCDMASGDIGFKKRKDGKYSFLLYDVDREHYGQNWMNRLAQRYAYHAATDALKEHGFELVDESIELDRSIHLTLRRMAV